MAQRPPYTTRLWLGGNATPGNTPGPQVPPGVVWVVRNVDLFTPGVLTEAVGSWRLAIAAGQVLLGWGSAQLAGARFYSWEGRQVVEAGEQLETRTTLEGFAWSITGYTLLLA